MRLNGVVSGSTQAPREQVRACYPQQEPAHFSIDGVDSRQLEREQHLGHIKCRRVNVAAGLRVYSRPALSAGFCRICATSGDFT